MGVVLYVVLTGNFPFKGGDNSALFKSIRSGELNLSAVTGSNEVKALLTCMMDRDVKKRATCATALAHEWLSGDVDSCADLGVGGSNKSSVAAVISNHTTTHSLNTAICTFQTRMCNSIDTMKKVKT